MKSERRSGTPFIRLTLSLSCSILPRLTVLTKNRMGVGLETVRVVALACRERYPSFFLYKVSVAEYKAYIQQE